MTLRVVLESTPRRSFATAIDWPGWSRSGKTPEAAIEALLAHAPRYAAVARRARVAFPSVEADAVEVVERLEGGGGTDFGVPGAIASVEHEDVGAADRRRLADLLTAAWSTFDAAAEAARGVSLRTGPRGGGRPLAKIVEHVREAEVAYLGQLGSRAPTMPAGGDPTAAIREAFLATLDARVRGEEPPNPRRTKTPWPPRYAVRRSAWHALDHAWEIEDRS